MFTFPFSQALVANQRNFNPLSGTQYEFLPEGVPHGLKLLLRATGTSVRCTVYSGSETIQEDSPVQAGGVAGTTPSELNTNPIQWVGAGGDRLKLKIDEVGGLTPTIDGVIVGTEII